MKEFGKLLRFYRRSSTDPLRGGRLTQERVGELLGLEIGGTGYSAAAVSEWERGRSHIKQADYRVLVALVKVLVQCNGMKTLQEAHTLLQAGNYRSLNDAEQQEIFSDIALHRPPPAQVANLVMMIVIAFEEMVSRPAEALRADLGGITEEPSPNWVYVFWEALGSISERVSSEKVFLTTLWVAVCWLMWTLVFPFTHWPFADSDQAFSAAIAYVVSSLVLPLLIGWLTPKRNDKFWQQVGLSTTKELRLYTLQGAILGYHFSFMLYFVLRLVAHYFGLRTISTWLEGLIATGIVLVSHMAARQVPMNLWRAYGELRLRHGAIFFVFILYGPMWGIFFLTFHPFLLSPETGILIIFLATVILSGLMTWQKRRTDSSVFPIHVWVIIFGALMVLAEWEQTNNHFATASLGCMLAIMVALSVWARPHLTLVKMVSGFLLPVLLMAAFYLHPLVGLGVMGSIAFAWWRWRDKYLWFPIGYWGVIVGVAVFAILIRESILTSSQASVAVLLTTVLLGALEKRRWR